MYVCVSLPYLDFVAATKLFAGLLRHYLAFLSV